MSGNFIDKYPYTDFHELNLDWIIKTVKESEKKIDDFTVFNAITWAGNWSAAKSYVKWSVVQDQDGNGYLSLQPVPTNVPLTNKNYWTQIAKYDVLYAAFEQRISSLETSVESDKNAINSLKSDVDKNNTGSIYQRLHGKVIIGLGDSLMIGSGEALGHTWLENIADQYGATCYNYGVSGSPIAGQTSNAMCQRLDAILDSNPTCDYFILEGGANDKNMNIPLGSINSESVNYVTGAVYYIIKRVRSKYGKNCHILCMTTYHRYDDLNDLGLSEQNYVNAVMLASSMLGIPCFNNYDNSGISLSEPIGTYPGYNTWADIGFTNGGDSRNHHFSRAGYEYLTPIYAAFIAYGYINNSAWREFYTTVNDIVFTKIIMPNGMSIVTANVPTINAAVHDLGGHLAYANLGSFNFPSGYWLSQVEDIQISTTLESTGTLITATCAEQNPFTSGKHSMNLNASIMYVGSSAPAQITGRSYITLIGFDQG